MGYISNAIEDTDGSIVGYMYTDKDGNTKAICSKALYQQDVVEDLTSPESGYKYYSYDQPETITDANGDQIGNLPRMSESALDEVQATSFKASIQRTMTSSQLTDADFSAKYKTFTEASFVEFKEGEYTIKTREEFIQYLDAIKALYTDNVPGDNIPINYFVAPEARFTIEDFRDHEEYKDYLSVMLRRHRFRNYTDYVSLIDWLFEKGVLKTKTPTMVEFLQAYYAWGPDGINAKCTNVRGDVNVDGVFMMQKFAPEAFNDTNAMQQYVYQNRRIVPSIVDGNLNMRYLRHTNNVGNRVSITEFGREDIIPASDDTIASMRRAAPTGHKYRVLRKTGTTNFCYLKDAEDRITIELLDEEGFSYTYAQTPTKFQFKRSMGVSQFLSADINFCVSLLVDSRFYVSIDNLHSKDDYILWNYASVKLQKFSLDNIVDPGVMSSSDLLKKIGMSPRSVVSYVSRYIVDNINDDAYRDEYSRIASAYNIIYDIAMCPIPDWLYESFMLNPEEPMSIKEFIEAADIDDLLYRQSLMEKGEIQPGDPEYDEHAHIIKRKVTDMDGIAVQKNQFDPVQDSVAYYTILNLVYECLYGSINIGNFLIGKTLDEQENSRDFIDIFMTLVYAELGDQPNLGDAIKLLDNIENNNLVSVEEIAYRRDLAYQGALIDRAVLAEQVNEFTWWDYINRVYREISNAPADKQRPYLLECISMDPCRPEDKALMTPILRLVYAALTKSNIDNKPFRLTGEDGKSYSLFSCISAHTRIFAARLFYLILGGQVVPKPGESVAHEIITFEDITIDVAIPADVINAVRSLDIPSHTVYITLREMCNSEYSIRAKRFLHHITNAVIDPWHVKPKAGYKIKELPLLANWHDANTLIKAQGKEFYELAVQNKTIRGSIRESINPINGNNATGWFLCSATVEDPSDYARHLRTELPGAKDVSYFDYILDYYHPEEQGAVRASEYIDDYVARWTLSKRLAKDKNKIIYSMPLVQDTQERAIADIYCDEVPATDIVMVDEIADPRGFINNVDVPVLSYAEELKRITTTVWKVARKYAYTDAIKDSNTFLTLLQNDLRFVREIYITRYNLTVSDGAARNSMLLSSLTAENIKKLIDDKMFVEIAPEKYVIFASNGLFVIEDRKE